MTDPAAFKPVVPHTKFRPTGPVIRGGSEVRPGIQPFQPAAEGALDYPSAAQWPSGMTMESIRSSGWNFRRNRGNRSIGSFNSLSKAENYVMHFLFAGSMPRCRLRRDAREGRAERSTTKER